MTYIKNNRLRKVFTLNANLHKVQSQENITHISHIQILSSTIYIFFYKEEQS